jgi:YVTN family beta-propeller protein
VATISTGIAGVIPTSVAISADGTRAYVTNEMGASVAVTDTKTHAVITTLAKIGFNPVAAATRH